MTQDHNNNAETVYVLLKVKYPNLTLTYRFNNDNTEERKVFLLVEC